MKSLNLKLLCLALFVLLSPTVNATEIGKPVDGAELFSQHCVRCHGMGVLMPTIAQMSKMTYDEVYHELWYGLMAKVAVGLEDSERKALARFIAGIQPDKAGRGHGALMCADSAPPTQATGNWPGWAPSADNARYLPAVNADIAATTLKWAFAFPDWAPFTSGGNQVSVTRARLYAGSLNQWVYALDPKTGCAHWAFHADGRIRSAVAVVNGVAVAADTHAQVYGLDADTGKLLWKRRADIQPDARVTGNITVHGDTVYVPLSSLEEVLTIRADLPCCTFRGSIVAIDVASGNIKWKTSMIEQPLVYLGETPNGAQRYGPAGVVVFAAPTVDPKRGLLYVATGNQTSEPFVPESDAIVALDLNTGKRKWIQTLAPEQMGGKDIYHLGCEAWVDETRVTCPPVNPSGHGDRDFGAPAILQTRTDGSDILLAGSKDGMLYALDPDKRGELMWRVRLGKGGEAGGIEYSMAADGERVYVPVNDMDADLKAHGSFSAVDLASGKLLWRVVAATDACEGKPFPCSNGYMSAVTVTNNAVIAGNNDGYLRAFAPDSGKLLWEYDTVRDYKTVNGIKGYGGAVAFGGPTIVDGMLYIMSGMGQLGIAMPGNVVLGFELGP